MKITKILITLTITMLASCAGLKSHQPKLDSTLVINKVDGVYRISTIKGDSTVINALLDKDFMNCNSTTFTLPRGNTVQSYIREIFVNELTTAKKFSDNGSGINVVVKTLLPDTSNMDKGTWTINIDYIENDKIMNVESVTTFESKMSLLSACVNTSNMFEEALADNFVEYFKRKARDNK